MKKTISLKTLLSSVILGILIFIGVISIFYNAENIMNNNSIVLLTFVINGLIIFLGILQPSKSPYRLMDIVNMFLFIFMFAAPLVQYLRDSFPWWTTYLITDEKIIYANILVFLFISFINIFYNSTKAPSLRKKKYYHIKRVDVVIDVFWFLSVIFSLFVINRVGFFNLFAQSTNSLEIENRGIWLIINYSFRSLPVIFVALSLLYYQKKKKIYKPIKFIIGLVLMILTNFPTGLSRFWVGSVYIGLIAILFKKNTKPNAFKILLLSGILIVFPIINAFRNLTVYEVFSRGINLAPLSDYFLAGDFDSYSMLVRALIAVEQIGLSWGYQLLGSIFFFVPRSIWTTKPVGSGFSIGTLLGWDFTNVSMPLIGEAYLNFGIIGTIVLAIAMGVLLKRLDVNYYLRVNNEMKEIYFIEIIFPFTLGFLFFIMRGDLLSSWAYYIGFMVPVIILYIVNRLIK